MDTNLIFHLCIHRGEAMYISVIDSIYFAHKDLVFGSLAIHHAIDYDYMHQLWNYIYYYISTKIH